ncbi:MAG: hypothetical protein JWO07_520 [Candidatus Saccharibacteria bacterium]|nr:hypothetical protein [Candidatus Saccharibacteria bacterium]
MNKHESLSTTIVSSDADMANIVSAVDGTPELSYEDVRGNAEIDSSSAFRDLMKDLHEVSAQPQDYSADLLRARIGNHAIIPTVIAPQGEFAALREFNLPTESGERPPVSEHKKRGLGRIAAGLKSIDAIYYSGLVRGMSWIPTAASHEDIMERDRVLKEKYARKESDGRFKRGYKYTRRNMNHIAAWAPVATIGTILGGLALYRVGQLGYDVFHHSPGGMTDMIPTKTPEVKLAVQTVDIPIGGHTQGDPTAYIESLKAAGIYDPNNVQDPVYWSAEMAPISGDGMPMNVSDGEGAQRIMEAVQRANGAPVRLIAFSQGTEATIRAMNQMAANNGGVMPDNVTVILQGTPSGDLGMGKNALIQGMNPILGAMGLETSQPIPPGAHVIVRTDIADGFGNSGNQSVLKMGEQLTGQGHRVVGPDNAVLISSYVKDGVTYEVWGDKDGINDPWMRTLRDAGMPITPQADALANAVLPYSTSASGIQYGNANNVVDKLGPAIDSYIPGDNGAGSRAVNAIFAQPGNKQDLQGVLGMEPIADEFADMSKNPQNIPADMQKISGQVNGGLQSAQDIMQHPTKIVDGANAALEANGIPGIIPQIFNNAPAAAPRASSQVHTQMGIPMTHLPDVPIQAAPAPAPLAVMPQQGLNFVNQLLNGFAGAGRR